MLIDNYIGHTVKRIILNLRKPDGKYYQLFTVYERNDYPSDVLTFPLNPQANVFMQRTSKSAKDKDSVYLVVDYLELDKGTIENPCNNICIKGSKILPIGKNYGWETLEGQELIVPADDNYKKEIKLILPKFLASCFVGAYISKNNISDFLPVDVKSQIKELSEKFLGFDLSIHSKYIGAVLFVRSNPIYSKIDFREDDKNPGIYCRIYFRNGKRLTLRIEVTGKDIHGNKINIEYFITNQEAFINHFAFKSRYELLDINVFDPNGNLIDYYTNVSFIHSISIDMGVMDNRVQYNDSEGKEHIVDKYSNEKIVVGEKEKIKSLIDSSEEYSYKRFEDALDFVFFDGDKNNKKKNKDKARSVINRILDNARNDCYICDPYFSVSELRDFIIPIKRQKVQIHILSSKEGLKSRGVEVRLKTHNPAYDSTQDLKSSIKECVDKQISNVDCRLMRGDRPISHDRFIVADDNAWLVGCSLNELGVRAASIVRVPKEYSSKIVTEIKKWWNDDKITDSL